MRSPISRTGLDVQRSEWCDAVRRGRKHRTMAWNKSGWEWNDLPRRRHKRLRMGSDNAKPRRRDDDHRASPPRVHPERPPGPDAYGRLPIRRPVVLLEDRRAFYRWRQNIHRRRCRLRELRRYGLSHLPDRQRFHRDDRIGNRRMLWIRDGGADDLTEDCDTGVG